MSLSRIKVRTVSGAMTERWVSESREEMLAVFEDERANYPTEGYGTVLTTPKLDPTGLLWQADFYRTNSCD